MAIIIIIRVVGLHKHNVYQMAFDQTPMCFSRVLHDSCVQPGFQGLSSCGPLGGPWEQG